MISDSQYKKLTIVVIWMIKLSQKEINLLHAKHGTREIKFRYDLLNYEENKIGELTCLGGNLGLNSLAQIKRKAKLNFKENEFKDVDWLNNKIQPFMLLKNGEQWIEYPLGVLHISSPERKTINGRIERQTDCYDSTLTLLEDRLDSRVLIKKGTNYIEAITSIINDAGIRKTNITKSNGELNTNKEYEIGTNRLDIANELLKELNYTSIWVDEMGYLTSSPYILPEQRESDYSYIENDISIRLADSSVEELDLFSVPNKFIIVASNPDIEIPLTSIYVNENASSKTSTVNRRRVISDFREVDDVLNQATLDQYTKRIAYETSSVFGKFSFDTIIMPHHTYMNSLLCEHKQLEVNSKFIETSWEMELNSGGKMNHNCRKVIRI